MAAAPNNVGPDPAGVRVSGTSGISFDFMGVIQGNPTIVVLRTGVYIASAVVNSQQNGVVVTQGGTANAYIALTLNQTDYQNWTVRARSDRDGSGTGVTFVGGMGGPPEKK